MPQGKSQLLTYLVNMQEAAREVDANISEAKRRLKKIETDKKERVLKELRAKNNLLAELLQGNQGLKKKLEDKVDKADQADHAPPAASTGKQEETTEIVKTLSDGSTGLSAFFFCYEHFQVNCSI